MKSCLNVASHLDPKFGGIVSSLPVYTDAIEREGRYRSPLAALCLPDENTSSADGKQGVHRFPYSRLDWLKDRGIGKRFETLANESQLLHIHGIWEWHCSAAAGCARRLRKPYIVSAHGMLDPWALQQSRWKKAIYSALIEKRNLASAACLRAMTENEATQYRDFGLRQPIAVIPNGIRVPALPPAELLLTKFPQLRGKRLILFLGRLHPKKGLIPLCRAWTLIAKQVPDAHLVVGGPDSDGLQAQLEDIIRQGGAAESVTFTGILKADLKWSALAAASAFTLPSYSEGFSIAILESLATGTPAIITDACYFPEAISAGAAMRTSPDEEAIVQSLMEALRLSPAELSEMGGRGKQLTETRYSWESVARQFGDLCDWLLGGPGPDTLRLIS